MALSRDILSQFHHLARALKAERAALQSRIAELNRVLADSVKPEVPTAADRARKTSPATSRTQPSSRLAKLGMREAIQQATAKQPLGVHEIVEAIQTLGFVFKSTRPQNSVGAYLYGPEGKKHFKAVNGKFSPVGGRAPSNGTRRKNRMSAAGRRAIAEAARRRWAKYKAVK